MKKPKYRAGEPIWIMREIENDQECFVIQGTWFNSELDEWMYVREYGDSRVSFSESSLSTVFGKNHKLEEVK